MKFVIRDDDLSYFSMPADIERWYSGVFAQGIPVGFSTIPFVKGVSDVYTAGASKSDGEHPVSENAALAVYVKGNPNIEILQHGCTHETRGGVYEYARTDGLIEETRRGKEELERAFGKEVTVFVPPHDWIGTHGIRAIEASGLDVIRGRGAGLHNFIPRWRYAANFARMALYRFPRYRSSAPPVYPYVLDFGKHKEALSYRLEDTDVFDGLEYALRKEGVFIVTMHVHDLSEGKVARLQQLIERARAVGAQFVHPSSLFAR